MIALKILQVLALVNLLILAADLLYNILGGLLDLRP
jgi:hypothetical protein